MIKNKLFSPKTICSLLAFTLLATAVTGCGKKTASNNNNVGNKAADASELLSEAQKASKDYCSVLLIFNHFTPINPTELLVK